MRCVPRIALPLAPVPARSSASPPGSACRRPVPRRFEAAAVWIEPWRHVTAAEMARVYRAEQARLVAALDWDTTATWSALEHARVAGAVSGLVARDGSGAIAGWTFFVERADELQIGAFTASAAARGPLLAALLAAPEAQRSPRLRLFGHTDAPGLAADLTARRIRRRRLRLPDRRGDRDGAGDRAWPGADLAPRRSRRCGGAVAGGVRRPRPAAAFRWRRARRLGRVRRRADHDARLRQSSRPS